MIINNFVVQIENLNKTIDGNIVFHNINLYLSKGNIYGFVGINGSGKSLIFFY
ncbi:ATP-binding cassette domain-containing protein [Clostridium sp. K25]|uniref:ATP-binding cassette domain-containing protein n=1 Tax=Clostridium sp. K25 TaxID=1443109 RepID=UPI0004D459AC|nr:hypothetical protein Z957_p0064 [Clostridium sp. K25]